MALKTKQDEIKFAANSFFNEGCDLKAKGNLQEAADSFKQCVRLRPDDKVISTHGDAMSSET